jgi:hypothetical protein
MRKQRSIGQRELTVGSARKGQWAFANDQHRREDEEAAEEH